MMSSEMSGGRGLSILWTSYVLCHPMHHMHPNRLEIYGRLEGASAPTGTS